MSKLSLTTNVDLQNYAKRVGDIAKTMDTSAIEFFSLPQNYLPKMQLELPEYAEPDKFAIINRKLAEDIGRRLRKHDIRFVQFHYPWQKTLLDMDGHDLALTIQFCDVILHRSCAERLTLNYHNVRKYPTLKKVEELDGAERKRFLNMLESQTIMSQHLKEELKSDIELIVENNPAFSIDEDKKTEKGIVDNLDLVAEDYIYRDGIDGTNLDWSHAWSVVEYFKGDRKCANLEWCRRQYHGVPASARSIESFVRTVAPKIKWIHLSDELDPYSHLGLYMGDGRIDFVKCLKLLDKYLPEETPATIEVKDGHKPEGFKRIKEHDFPVLEKLIKSL